jgi:hypothetical protein
MILVCWKFIETQTSSIVAKPQNIDFAVSFDGEGYRNKVSLNIH